MTSSKHCGKLATLLHAGGNPLYFLSSRLSGHLVNEYQTLSDYLNSGLCAHAHRPLQTKVHIKGYEGKQ